MKKTAPLFIVISLAVNVTLIGLLATGLVHRRAVLVAPAVKRAAPAVDPDIWPSLRTSELPVLVSRLRAAGFPSEMIRAIATAQLAEAYVSRRKALDLDPSGAPFWRAIWPDPRQVRARRRMEDEQKKIIQNLLGDNPRDAFNPSERIAELRLLKSVPPEKRERVQQLMREIEGKESVLLAESSRGTDRGRSDAIHRELNALERARLTALKQILSPPEFTEYELRMSVTAKFMRSGLAELSLTEEEFRGIFQLQRSFDAYFAETWTAIGAPAPEAHEYREARAKLHGQIKAMLGPQRGEEYVRATDDDYQVVSKIVARLQLPPETAVQLWTVQREVEKRAEAITGNRTLPVAERIRQVAELAAEARTKTLASLGSERAFEVYKQYGGRWLSDLQPSLEPAGTE